MCFGIIFYTNSLKCIIEELWKNIYDTIVNKKIFDKWSKANTEKVENLVWYIFTLQCLTTIKKKEVYFFKAQVISKNMFWQK